MYFVGDFPTASLEDFCVNISFESKRDVAHLQTWR